MKPLLLAFTFLFVLSYRGAAQTVAAEYLEPKINGTDTDVTVFGTSTNLFGGILWNRGTFFGDGEDFGLRTYNNKDMVLATNAGRLFLNTARVGISTHQPQAKLHIPNGDIIVGGVEGIMNTLNSSIFVKSRADNNITYPLYIGKYGSGQDLFWVRGEGNAYLRGNFGIGTNIPEGQLQIDSENPLMVIGAEDKNTNGQSALKFYAGKMVSSTLYANVFSISYMKDQGTDRLAFFDGGTNEVLTLKNGGRVGIGTNDPDATLTVKGKIHTQEVLVDLLGAVTPDYVFEETYDLATLAEVEAFIKANKHLPEIPSAREMERDGMNLKVMNLLLLKKVEELTLHVIRQQKQLDQQREEIRSLKKLVRN